MKKSIKSILAAAGFAIMFASCTQNDVHKMRTISVSGTGKVFVTPDKATVDLSVITRNNDIKAAQKENAEAMKNVQDAVLALGIPAENIQTYDYGISQETHWKNDERIYGMHRVTNCIKVTVQDIEKAGDVIDVAIKNGATGVDGISFSYEDEVKAVKRARTLAIENAKAIAEESVSVAGTKLGKVLVMEEKNNKNYLYPTFSNSVSQVWADTTPYAAGIEGGTTPISSGKKEISIVMNIVYELK